MKHPETREITFIQPTYTEEEAKKAVEYQKKRFGKGEKRTGVEWLESLPVYVPFWLVEMEMDLYDPRMKTTVPKRYRAIVNGLTCRGMLLQGDLQLVTREITGVIVDNDHPSDKIREAARLDILSTTRKLLKPPPHRVLPNERLFYYPMSMVHCTVKGKEDVRMFDYFRGGLDKMFLNYLRYKERNEEKRTGVKTPNPIPKF